MTTLAELLEEDPGPWMVGEMTCAACHGTQVTLFPVCAPRLECLYCHEFNPAPTTRRPVTEDDLKGGAWQVME